MATETQMAIQIDSTENSTTSDPTDNFVGTKDDVINDTTDKPLAVTFTDMDAKQEDEEYHHDEHDDPNTVPLKQETTASVDSTNKTQTETNDNRVETDEKQMEENKQKQESMSLKCVCGGELTSLNDSKYDAIECWYCKVTTSDGYVCGRRDGHDHFNARQMCVDCIKMFNHFEKLPVKKIHDRKSMYYIYNNNEISGPYTVDEIISSYILNRFKTNIIYIMSAGKIKYRRRWYKIQIPHQIQITSAADHQLLIKEYETKNSTIKTRFPVLYYNLIENVLSETLRPIFPAPHEIPDDLNETTKKKSFLSMFLMFSGRVLAFLMLFVVVLHIWPFALIGICFITIVAKFDHDDIGNKCFFVFYVTIFLGMIISPIVVVYIILFQTDIYSEIQSWQIAYCVWGIMSFTMTMAYMVTLFLMTDPHKITSRIKGINNVILYIVGVDFGQLDIIGIIETSNFSDVVSGKGFGIKLLLLMPQLAGLLPAAISGFIANYILQEKFELKCRENIVNKNICFDSSYGCCEVISSHNWENTYAFIGGLASNILATWAVIRICGYLLVNAYPQFSVHAKRTK